MTIVSSYKDEACLIALMVSLSNHEGARETLNAVRDREMLGPGIDLTDSVIYITSKLLPPNAFSEENGDALSCFVRRDVRDPRAAFASG